MRVKINDQIIMDKLLLRIRLDFKAEEKSARFLFGGKTNEAMAEIVREQQLKLLKNIPLQGVTLEDFDSSMDVYLMTEESDRRTRTAAYAPLVVTLKADNIESVFPFLVRSEFRKIEILGPENLIISKTEIERLMFSIARVSREISEKR